MNVNPLGNPIITIPDNAEQPTRVVRADEEDEFGRFASLTSKLTQVPKSEIKEQRTTA
jgi:hypothetical protein